MVTVKNCPAVFMPNIIMEVPSSPHPFLGLPFPEIQVIP